MLANTVAASPPSRNFKFGWDGPQFRTPLYYGNLNLQNRCSSSSNCCCSHGSMKWTTTRGFALVVRAGYTRKPLENAGAYQLIDDETGEKFIVWGGNDDDDPSSIPSKEVLSWKPSENNNSKKANVEAFDSSEDDFNNENNSKDHQTAPTRAYSRGLAGSFGRLKAQRVRDLVQGTRWMKQAKNSNHYDGPNVKDAISCEPGLLEEQKRLDVLKDRWNDTKDSQLQETRYVMQNVETKEDMDHSEMAVKHRVVKPFKHQTAPIKSKGPDIQKKGANVSISRASASSLRGWGHGEPIYNFRSKLIGISEERQKYNADGDFFSRKSFKDLGCSDYMIEALRSQLLLRPSCIQAMAFASAFEGRSCIIADQSGSGKTLAYLLPVIQRLREEELQGLSKSLSQNPRVVILVPTAELASQVLSNCRLMSKFGVPFRSMVATGGFRQKTQLENLRQDIDVLIATPGRFMFLIKEGFLQLTNLRCAVLDEVDILFKDEDFETGFQSLMNLSSVTTQYLFVTATLPVDIYNKLIEVFPDCEVIMGPGMHRTSPGLEEILVDCSGDDEMEKTPETAFLNKKSALLRLIEESPVSRTIVFCNKIETCRKVENTLRRFDRRGSRIRVLPFHAALEQESRLANMEEFRSTKLQDGHLFLVCTDRASRGIDFAGVDHVVLFDFPRDPSEYVRRVGRTARGAGGQGKAFIFVVGKQVSLARRIIERNLKGHPLHDVPSAYDRMS